MDNIFKSTPGYSPIHKEWSINITFNKVMTSFKFSTFELLNEFMIKTIKEEEVRNEYRNYTA